jgi:hypothetical protein
MGAEALAFKEKRNTFRLKDGSMVTVRLLNKVRFGSFGSVTDHEKDHAYVASKNGTLRYVTIRSEGNSLGHAALTQEDKVAAAASIAHGHSGTGHDAMLVGKDTWAIRAAREMMAGKELALHAIGTALEEETTLSAARVANIIADIEGGPTFLIEIQRPDGKVSTQTKAGRWSHGMLTAKDIPVESLAPSGSAYGTMLGPVSLRSKLTR